MKSAFGKKTINAIVIDTTVDRFTAAVFVKVFSSRRTGLLVTDAVLEDDAVVVSLLIDDEDGEDDWRKYLLLWFKDEVFIDSPSAFTSISFKNIETQSAFNLIVTNDGNNHFFSNLNRTICDFENNNSVGLTAKVEVVNGGEWLYQDDFTPSRSFLPDDYDQTEPLKQWEKQMPMGHQFILQLEPNPSSKKKVKISANTVKKATDNAISKSSLPGFDNEKYIIKEYKKLGDGYLCISFWEGGSVAVLWDGKEHVDINLFTYKEDIEIGNTFSMNFRNVLPLTTMLRDEQPRGAGRVVSYRRDLADNLAPHWA